MSASRCSVCRCAPSVKKYKHLCIFNTKKYTDVLKNVTLAGGNEGAVQVDEFLIVEKEDEILTLH